jgi:hypothetical protein
MEPRFEQKQGAGTQQEAAGAHGGIVHNHFFSRVE